MNPNKRRFAWCEVTSQDLMRVEIMDIEVYVHPERLEITNKDGNSMYIPLEKVKNMNEAEDEDGKVLYIKLK